MLPSRPRVGESPLPRKLRNACAARDPAREMAGELAVERRADVVGAERVAGGGGHGLLPAAGVDRARDAPAAVEHADALLDQPVHEHEPEEREPILARDLVRVARTAAPRARRGSVATEPPQLLDDALERRDVGVLELGRERHGRDRARRRARAARRAARSPRARSARAPARRRRATSSPPAARTRARCARATPGSRPRRAATRCAGRAPRPRPRPRAPSAARSPTSTIAP